MKLLIAGYDLLAEQHSKFLEQNNVQWWLLSCSLLEVIIDIWTGTTIPSLIKESWCTKKPLLNCLGTLEC